MRNKVEIQKGFESSAAIFMAIVGAINLLALTCWLFNQPILASLHLEGIPMTPSTVLIFLGLSVTWFINRAFSARRGLRIIVQAGLMGMLIMVLILSLRSLTGFGLDLEQWLILTPTLFGQILTDRMSLQTALGFFLVIPGFLLMTSHQTGKRIRSASAALSLVVFILSSLNILGHLYRAPLFYGGTIIPVVLSTAISFWFLSLALLMNAGPACWPARMYVGPSLSALLMRKFIPATIFIVLVQGFLSSATVPWINNPALKVAVAALISFLIVFLIISLISKKLSERIERGNQAEEALLASEAELRALFTSMHDVVLVIDRNGVYRKIAPTNPELLIRPSEYLLGKTLRDVFPSDQAETFINVVQQVLDKNQTAQIEYDLTISDRTVHFETSISPMMEDSTLWVARDITKRKQGEQELLKLSMAVDDSSEAIFMTDREGLITFVNPGFTRLYGYTAEETVGKTTPRILKSGMMKPEDYATFWQILLNKQVIKGELINKTKGGQLLTIEGSANPILNQQEEIVGFLAIQHDITDRKQMEQEIRNLSMTDELTGLYNRRGFTLLAEQEMKLVHRYKKGVVLFFVDVDGLKVINDSLGHAQGDLALGEVATVLKETFREADILARIGGDEFVILAPDSSMESADILINRIQANLEKRNQQGNRPYQLTFSIGMASYDPESPATISELITQADGRMYQQKQAGKEKNQVKFFNRDTPEAA